MNLDDLSELGAGVLTDVCQDATLSCLVESVLMNGIDETVRQRNG